MQIIAQLSQYFQAQGPVLFDRFGFWLAFIVLPIAIVIAIVLTLISVIEQLPDDQPTSAGWDEEFNEFLRGLWIRGAIVAAIVVWIFTANHFLNSWLTDRISNMLM